MSKTDYRFEARNKSIFTEEIPLFLDYRKFHVFFVYTGN